jgi:glutamate-1-semialdehyde aminotransferase
MRDATLVCRYNDLDDVRDARAPRLRRRGDHVEPVAHNSPGLLLRSGFLQGLASFATRPARC